MSNNHSIPLLRNLVLFGRVLRLLGVPVTPGQTIGLASALSLVDLFRREDVYNASRAVLVNRYADIERFDRAFAMFWRVWREDDMERSPEEQDAAPFPGAPPLPPIEMPRARQMDSGSVSQARGEAEVSEETDDIDEGSTLIATWSRSEQLRERDFALMTDDELADARRLLESLKWKLTRRRSRRMRPAAHGRRPDFRRTFRRSLASGGELAVISWRGPKLKRRALVVLCDISGSMDRYSRLFLHFVHALERDLRNVEVFVFGTRLTRITRELAHRDPDLALARVAAEVQDWSGGTRIGEAIATFNRVWSRRVLDRGPIVLVISDGWDRGDPDLLAREMARLQRNAFRLIWLNPLLGASGYEPLTRGLQAALPYVDDFLPVHTLASLQDLAVLLNGIQDVRPDRGTAHPDARMHPGMRIVAPER